MTKYIVVRVNCRAGRSTCSRYRATLNLMNIRVGLGLSVVGRGLPSELMLFGANHRLCLWEYLRNIPLSKQMKIFRLEGGAELLFLDRCLISFSTEKPCGFSNVV